jgi:hypothetical protein
MSIITYLRRFLAACLAVFCLLPALAQAGNGSEGRDFYLAFQPNYGGIDFLYLYISGQKDTQGTVEIKGLNFKQDFQVKAGVITSIDIPKAAGMLPVAKVSQLTVHVTAQDDISVYGMNRRSGTTDGFLALPVDALGLEYYTLSYTPYSPSQVTLIAPFDGTTVTVTSPSGTSSQVKLNAGDSYMMTSGSDMSGTRVVATAPVAVMAGVEAALVPAYANFLDHIVEMMPPVSTWGKSFLTVPLATRKTADIFRVIAAQDNTRITVNGALVTTLKRGGWYEFSLSVRSVITASAPVLLEQFAVGTSMDGVDADPFEMTIPPTEQFLTRYTFSTPNDTGYPRQFVNVVVPTGAIGTLRLDGAAVAAGLFSPIGTSGFSGGQLPVSPGSHTIASTDAVPFGIYVYGFGYHDSYGYPGGMSFAAINPMGDPYPPGLRLVAGPDTVQGTATDSEDANANGVLDAGEDSNANGAIDRRNEDRNGNGRLDTGEDANNNATLDRDTGVFKIELSADSQNLKLNIPAYVPGVTSVQFSVTRIDPTKPGTGKVVVIDGAGNKAQGVVEIGVPARMQNVRVVATVEGSDVDIDTASFRTAPFSVNRSGSTQVVEWRYPVFSVDTSADLGFDVIVRHPVAGEQREVARQVDLYYLDAAGAERHTALDRASVQVLAATVGMSAATDKPAYAEGETLLASSQVRNLAAFANAVQVKFSLLDNGGALVSDLGTLPVRTLDAGASGDFGNVSRSLAGLYAGSYRILAEAFDAAGVKLAQATGSFTLQASGGGVARVSATLATDKQTYNAGDTLVLTERLGNLATDLPLAGLTATTTVVNPDGTLRFTQAEPIVQLVAGINRDLQYRVPLNAAAAGAYRAALKVTDAKGAVLAAADGGFNVASSASTGAGISGTLTVSPALVPLGDSVAFSYAVGNAGNAAFDALPVKLSVIDPVAKRVRAEFPATLPLAAGGSANGAVNWLAEGNVGDTYVAMLSAAIGGRDLALAQGSFTLAPPPVKLDLTQAGLVSSRVLVLLADGDTEVAGATRSQVLDAALNALGAAHFITGDAAEFTKALRSGQYNTLWLSGKLDKLDALLVQEITEASFDGAALLIDGDHDERNKALDALAGITWRGKLGQTGLQVTIGGAELPAASLTTAGRALKLELAGGRQQARFAGTQPTSDGPALVSNVFGSGRVFTFAFDLVGTLAAQSGWQDVLARVLGFTLPQAHAALTPGEPVSLRLDIANQARATDLRVRMQLPAGATVLGSVPAASIEAGIARWSASLAEAGSTAFALSFAAPAEPGNYAVTTSVASARNGLERPYGEPLVLALGVQDAAVNGAAARVALTALALTTNTAQKARSAAIAQLDDGLAQLRAGTVDGYAAAIAGFAAAADGVASLPADTAVIRHQIDALLREAQWRWWQIRTR